MTDPYLYDDCDVIRNKFGIKDSALLEKAEVDISCNAIHDILMSPLNGDYDFAHFCIFHAYIFGEIYDWAGKPRTIPIEKEEAVLGYMSINYTKPQRIEYETVIILERMKGIKWETLSIDEQARELSSNMAELWKVHPFREGNTRTTVTFVCQFAESRGMALNRELFERNAIYTRNALVAATAIFPDGDFRKPEYLFKIVKDSLEQGGVNSHLDVTGNQLVSNTTQLKMKAADEKG
jgi:cell filamentation protein